MKSDFRLLGQGILADTHYRVVLPSPLPWRITLRAYLVSSDGLTFDLETGVNSNFSWEAREIDLDHLEVSAQRLDEYRRVPEHDEPVLVYLEPIQ